MVNQWQEHFKRRKSLYFIYFLTLFFCIGILGFKMAQTNQAVTKTLTADVVNMRKGPAITYDIEKQVKKNTTYQIMDETDDWFFIRLQDNTSGWVPKWIVDPATFAETSFFIATVLSDKATVYEDNSKSSQVLSNVQKNAKFQILHQIDGWIQIQTDEGTGWITQDTIEITPGTIGSNVTITEEMQNRQEQMLTSNKFSVVATAEGVNIRSAPETGSEIIAKTTADDVMTYIGQEGQYYHVQLDDGQQGYIANWLAESNSTAMADLAKEKEATTTLKDKTIMLDPGHGGEDPGAINDSTYEKIVTLKTALAIKEKLESAGAKVLMTRDEDETVSLGDRAIMTNESNADIFISLHYDAYESISASGTSTYHYSDEDKVLADAIQAQLLEQLPLSSNGVRFGDFQVLRETTNPSILLELGYMSNPSDVKTFTQDEYYTHVAESVYDGLVIYFQ